MHLQLVCQNRLTPFWEIEFINDLDKFAICHTTTKWPAHRGRETRERERERRREGELRQTTATATLAVCGSSHNPSHVVFPHFHFNEARNTKNNKNSNRNENGMEIVSITAAPPGKAQTFLINRNRNWQLKRAS